MTHFQTNRRISENNKNLEYTKIPPTASKYPEKIYRYTKYRIPGYDYDEFDFYDKEKSYNCDGKSLYAHCVCQFTCKEPNIVDCYMPCSSGCECKEDFVFDDRVQKCVLPEQCQPDDDMLLLK